ncbi:MAG: Gfo/Idh/MocA family oxidoreductase [Cytophagales bacterium]|nr:Gfo/Idh/MocA family oxidoreductase [Cytophagales bacterium]MCA6369430.1 Gfo/Idh/MocA family oxidoreductase [Cytophagales bacterium]MCA6374062.1 Gfo/Idh/MocA family oxidoreductase [Cytophagales bacterium]MCA6377656.1 Gfo/Idh/MocA family oxidoreductase [Cytophagales bacterium]MCA6383638.1 Gfo/Idh/MocA family oxidoreductase [Cytophagales bacterium]
MNQTIRWGILGCGKIARKFAGDLQWVSDAKLVAIGAREQSTADAFAKDFPVEYKHNSYKALAENPEVDVIYVATPHALHHEHVMLCLQHKKAVLVEKAFAINYSQAKQMIDFAKSQQTFLMEAFWTRFLPHYLKVKEMIAEGRIGTIRYINAEFGFKPTPPVSQRIYDPALGGGSLLDVGVYPVFLALDLLGKPDHIQASMVPAPSGVDEQCSIQFKYNNGAMANLFSSFATNLATGADIAGDQGRIRLTHRFHGPTTELEFYPGVVDSKQTVAFEKANGNGYEYEAQHVTDCLKKGLTESPLRTHIDTLILTQTLDQIRSIGGICYPAD